MIFINTRPASRAQLLTDAMKQQGLAVLELPLLELAALDISEREQQYQHDFCHELDKYQALVVVSPTAARLGLSACPKGFVPNCAVIAVGHATAQVLEAAGWQVQCPEEYSNEGMIKMASLNRLGEGDHMLVWRGRGGRRVLVNFLQDNGVVVHAIAWYQRRCPANTSKHFLELQQRLQVLLSDSILLSNNPNTSESTRETQAKSAEPKPIALVSSGEAFTNWRALFDDVDSSQVVFKLEDFDYLTFGKRLTDMLDELELHCVRIEHLDAEEVWRGVQLLRD